MTATEVEIGPGVWRMTAEQYHADPVPGGSLSSSGARLLLPPNCPAIFRHRQLHGEPHKNVWDFGTAAHLIVLGEGPEVVVVDADDWRTKAAREARDEARERGATAVLSRDWAKAEAMADAIRRHPIASALLAPGRGDPEQALIWADERTGVMRRALLDWLPRHDTGRLIIPDYKTAASAEPKAIAKAVANYGYHQQDAWYCDGVKALGIDDDPAFVFIVQEKTPPFLVTVVELDADARRIGRQQNRTAIDIYARCIKADRWPGYTDDVQLLSLPPWFDPSDEGEFE